MEDLHGHRISYLRVSITDRCNERCRYCMPQENQEWLPRSGILSYEEILRVLRVGVGLGIRKVRLTGGEPLTRREVLPFIRKVGAMNGIEDLGISTNGTLLAASVENGGTTAQALVDAGVRTVNISLDTLDRQDYQFTTGRDYLSRVLEGIAAAREAGFEKIKLNAVLIRGKSEAQLAPLIDYSRENEILLRFIELMPVSTRDVLEDSQFFPTGKAKKLIEEQYGELVPRPEFKTNGPASYFQLPGEAEQKIGFIGAMTNLHFCESCNKLRLTCDGKLRPCLGSYLEFDFLKEIRRPGATDEELAAFFHHVVERKPKEHDFRDTYKPGRAMVAIGG